MAKTLGQEMSQYHEKRLAKAVGGRTTPASGAFWGRKGDVEAPDILIEHKWTGKDRYTVKAETLEKICTEAIFAGRMPVFMMDCGGHSYVILQEDDFMEMLRKSRLYDEMQ